MPTPIPRPPFGKSVLSFPTPLPLLDKLIWLDIDSRLGRYEPLAYETLHPNQTDFPGYFLVNQAPLNQDDGTVRRWYSRERMDQHTYNWEHSFPYGSEDYPRVVRTYVFARANYVPLAPLTADPVYSGLKLIAQEQVRSDAPEIDSAFVIVRRIFEKVPGVEIVSKQFNERGDLTTITTQIVEDQTAPDADGLLVTGSQVKADNTIVGQREVSTVTAHATLTTKSKGKPELIPAKFQVLVTTTAVEDIVPPSTNPTAITGDLKSSVVEQTTRTKATRTDTTEVIDTEADPLVGQQTFPGGVSVATAESIVVEGTPADHDFLTVESSSDPLGDGNSILTVHRAEKKEDGDYVPGWPKQYDKQSDGRDLTPVKFRASVTRTTEVEQKELADPDALPDPTGVIGVDDVIFVKTEKVNDERFAETTTRQTINEDLAVLDGEEAFPGGVVAATTEALVTEGTAATKSFTVIESVVSPLGDGNAVKTVKTAKKKSSGNYVAGWPKKYEKKKDGQDLIPPKFRALATQEVEVEQKTLADPDVLPDPVSVIGTDDVISAATEKVNDERYQETTVTLTVDPNASVPSTRINSRGDVETVGESIVDDTVVAGTSFLTTESHVDGLGNGKAVKTLATVEEHADLTGRENGPGLLGDLIISDEIVPAGSAADALSTTVVSSVVTPIDSTKSKKVTKTGSVSSLGGKRKKAGLLGETSISKSIVAAGSTADALSTTVVSSEVIPIDGSKSEKTTETASGPTTLAGIKINARGDAETTTQSIVVAGASPDTDSLLQVSSEVEPIDSAKSQKTTVTVPSYSDLTTKSLGSDNLTPAKFRGNVERQETQSIVVDETEPTPLTGDIVQSTVKQVSATKAERVDVTESIGEGGPLAGLKTFNQFGGGVATVEESIVEDGDTVDGGLSILDASVETLGNGKSVKTVVTAPTYAELDGSTYIPELDIVAAYTEQVVTPPVDVTADAHTEYNPIDQYKSLKRTIIPPTAALDAYLVSFPSNTTMNLPETLLNIEVVWAEDVSEGSNSSDWEGAATGPSTSLDGSESGSASSSAALVPQLLIDTVQTPAANIDTTSHFFFLPIPVTKSDILTKLGASAWPVFRPEGHTIVLNGMKASIGASASAKAEYQVGPSNEMYSVTRGEGTQYDVNAVFQTINLPPMLHAAISIAGEISKTATVNAASAIGWVGFGGFPSVTVDSEAEKTINGFISPSGFAATSPAAIPTSGTYLIDCRVEPYKWGYARIFAETLDASVFAPV